MRVLLVSRVFAPEAAAASFRLSALVCALAGRGARVEVITAAAPRDVAQAASYGVGVRVRRWPVWRDAAGYVRGYLPYLSFDLPLPLRLLARRPPDVVVVEPPPTTGALVRAVCALWRTPYVYYAADIWSDATASMGAPAPVVWALRALERFALRGARAVIAVSEGVGERAQALGGRDVSVIPNGIDPATFTPDGPTTPTAPQVPFLLYAGTASEWQGAEIFAEAMRDVLRVRPDARLVFLGQGSSWPALQAVRGSLPAGVIELRPLVPAEEAAAWHRSAAAALVSVRPGIGYDFAYPTKVLASLACGTPVVFTGPGPAARDIAADPALGEAVPYDVGSVAAAMLRVLRAIPEEAARRHRVDWVHRHRSLSATAARAAETVLVAVSPRGANAGPCVAQRCPRRG